MKSRTLALLALLLGACGESELTQTVIFVEAEDGVKQRADHTTLVVTALAGGAPTPVHSDEGAPRAASFPYVIALEPRADDADRVYQVEVKALAQGQTIAVARLVSGYVPKQTRYVTLELEDACLNKPPCAANQSCHLGMCVDARVDPGALGRDRDNPPATYTLPPPGSGTTGDASVTGDGGARDAASAPSDASTPVDAGLPRADAGPADAGPADAGNNGNDGGAPPDGGLPPLCAPFGPWNLQFTETSGTCGLPVVPVAVMFAGRLTDYLSDPVNCEYESSLSSDGCTLDYSADCTSVDNNGQEFTSFELGTLTMTSANQITGVLDLDIEYADDTSCTASGEVVGAPSSP